jgi:rod shape-determining protein MreC
VLLNKGSESGILRDMPVVTDKGLVGLVTETTPTASKVVLITDLSSAVNVRLQNSRAEGVVLGQQSGELRLNYISIEVDMKQDERVVTSGLGGQFPQGILVGTVASVRKRTFDVFQEADVKSSIDFNRLETLLVITNYERPNILPLIGTPAPTTP